MKAGSDALSGILYSRFWPNARVARPDLEKYIPWPQNGSKIFQGRAFVPVQAPVQAGLDREVGRIAESQQARLATAPYELAYHGVLDLSAG